MPVPVPRIAKPLAHPVIKRNQSGFNSDLDSFQNLTRTLPEAPTGPPPSLGTREQWINSLPSWRRQKTRRIWEDDACPEESEQPQYQRRLSESAFLSEARFRGRGSLSSLPFGQLTTASPVRSPLRCDGDADDEMGSDMDQSQHDDKSQWSAASGDIDMEIQSQSNTARRSSITESSARNEFLTERGVFTPLFEEESLAGCEIPASPFEPVTPFGQFVDRAVAAAEAYGPGNSDPVPDQDHGYDYQDPICPSSCCQPQPCEVVKQSMEPASTTDLVVTPAATTAYKKLAEPLADWVANYVWKACTTGMSLPFAYSRPK
jgi:hypothetical protein